jgi:5-methylcytosine-specific restriction endonuclease McrA
VLPLTTPEDDAGDVFAAAARRTRDLDRRAALLGQRKYVAGRAAEYLRLARVNRLFSLKEMVPVGIAAKELENLYSRVLVNGGERPLYERLVGSAPRRMCPLCGQRDVGTLDHYLSKSVFPELSVFPANLVPACATCNHSKGSAQCLTAYEQLFHPYFDNWSKYRLLSAKIDI